MKRILLAIVALVAVGAAKAQSWKDITQMFVQNPTFVGNKYNGWEGDTWGANGAHENAEHFNRTFNTYQTITGLPAGKVRLSCKGFYRAGTSANDYTLYSSGNYRSSQHAQLYIMSSVSSYTTPIVLASSGKTSSSLGGSASGVGKQTSNGWWTEYEYYIPNNMEAAYYWFTAGYYNNSVEGQVGSDGTITIGVSKYSTINQDWVCVDDFKLEWYGTEVKATAVTLESDARTMVIGETYQINAGVLPENTTFKNFIYTTSNSKVATVDANGVVKAVGLGTTNLRITCGSVSKSLSITVKDSKPTAGALVINEIMAANIDVYRDPSTNFGSWVEVYNPTDNAVSLGNLYVTDDETNLKKNKLTPDYGAAMPKGFAILNFDHHEVWTPLSYRQIDDKLDTEGGKIIISDGTTIIAEATYPAATSRMSYARTTDGGDTWGTCCDPTPGASNNDGTYAKKQLEAPVVSVEGQMFTGTLKFNVTIPEGAILKYTTDGTAPTMKSGQISTNGSFSVSDTKCYRFRLFQDGMIPSAVVTRSFIKDNGNYPFNAISITTDANNLFESDYGIYNYSEYGRTGNGQTSKYNANMEWDRPVNFEYMVGGKAVLSQECDLSACGGWSRGFTPHSFKLKATKAYDGMNYFPYQFFDAKPYAKHKTLQIRNGGNDNGCRIKDAVLQQIVATSGLYVDYQEYQPVHVFVNGQHYAVLNMREPNNKHHGYANYGIDTDFMEQFEINPDSGYVQKEGTGESFERWYTLSKTAAQQESYEEICQLVDIDEYTNYMAVQMYLGGTDFPQNNIKGYRDITEGAEGKFHFVLFDLDFAFNTNTPFTTFAGKRYYTSDALHGYDYSQGVSIEGKTKTSENKFVSIFLNMLNNETFKKKLVDAYCLVGGSVMTPERVSTIVNAVAANAARGGYINPSNTANDIINKASASRQTQMISHLRDYLKLPAGRSVAISSNLEDAKLVLNDMEIPTGRFNGTLFGDITVKAQTPAGYKFLGWSNSSSTGASSSTTLLPASQQWNYYDKGSLDNTEWYGKNYDAASWSKGMAPLGYGKSDNKTNNLAANKTCYYFRTEMDINNAVAYNNFKLNYSVDDGFIIYVNGSEAGRYNMPSGNVSFSTVSTTYANGNPDNGSMSLDQKLFREGKNTIAVEVHNNQASSSDIVWQGSITASYINPENIKVVSTEQEYTIPASGQQSITAIYTALNDEDKDAATAPVVINEVSAANTIFINDNFKKDDWMELHNTTNEDIDIAGLYITDNMEKPTKYQVPANSGVNTVIPARGYMVIWCAKRTSAGKDLYTQFKLSEEGAVKITMMNEGGKEELYSDTFEYGLHSGTQSVGRYQDGRKEIYTLDVPTPGTANKYNMYAVLWENPNETGAQYVSADDDDEVDDIENGVRYNLAGQVVGNDYKGVIIVNGKKYLNK